MSKYQVFMYLSERFSEKLRYKEEFESFVWNSQIQKITPQWMLILIGSASPGYSWLIHTLPFGNSFIHVYLIIYLSIYLFSY